MVLSARSRPPRRLQNRVVVLHWQRPRNRNRPPLRLPTYLLPQRLRPPRHNPPKPLGHDRPLLRPRGHLGRPRQTISPRRSTRPRTRRPLLRLRSTLGRSAETLV